MLEMRLNPAAFAFLVVVTLASPCAVRAQDTAAEEPVATEQPTTTAPADGRRPITAKVIDVQGDAKHAPLGSNDWKDCALDDEYPERTTIRTGIRSSVKLMIGSEEPYTAMVIDSVGFTIISEAYKTEDTKCVRIGVGHGRIRAGVAEGGLKSEFTVDTPVATLSKRGTWNFGVFYERDTDRFEFFLLDRGFIEVLNKLTRERRGLKPGEIITHAMRRWLDQAKMLRNVPVVDLLGQADIELAFNRISQDGLGVTGVGHGRAVLINLSNDSARRGFANMLQKRLARAGPLPTRTVSLGPPLRAEGFFGSGRGDELLDVLIAETHPLSQKGFAKPGSYKFRRSAIEHWLKNFKKRH